MPDLGSEVIAKVSVEITNGTYVHANGTTEDDVIEVTNNLNKVVISLDVSLLTQNTTIRTYEKIDGTNYELTSSAIFPTEFDTGAEAVRILLNGKNRDQKLTFQSGTSEGATRDIPFSRVDEVRAT